MNQTPTDEAGAPVGSPSQDQSQGQSQDQSQDQAHDQTGSYETPRPRPSRPQLADVEQFRRSNTDRYLGGVCGGLGRHFDVDPMIIRVAFAVTAFFGVGILLYAALWLLLPDDTERAALSTTNETRRVLIWVTLGLGALMLLGAMFGNDGWGLFPFALVVVAGAWIYVLAQGKEPTGPYRDHPGRPDQPGQPGQPHQPSQPGQPLGYPVPAAGGERPAYSAAYSGGHGGGPADAAAWPPPQPPARPRRSGLILFWPTLALIAIGLGSLAIYDANHHVAGGAYAALALGIIGLMLVVGAFVGRAGGLILIGLLSVPPLAISSVLGNDFSHITENRIEQPMTVHELGSTYDMGSGRLELDLTRMPAEELATLVNHHVEIDVDAGEVVVRLPAGVDYSLDAALRIAGEIVAGEHQVSGPNPVLTTNVHTSDEAPSIDFDIEGAIGRIELIQKGQ